MTKVNPTQALVRYQNAGVRKASRASVLGSVAATSMGSWTGAWRNTSAWSGTVVSPSISAMISSARRQPYASIRAFSSGRKMKLARPADQGDRGQCFAPLGAGEPLGDHRERRLVEDGRHRHAQRRPQQIERPQRFDPRPDQHPRRGRHRPDGHEQPGAVPVQPAAHQDRGQPGGGEGDRVGAGELDPAPAQFGLHRLEHHRKAVEKNAPADGLGDRQCGDDHPPIPSSHRRRVAR